jgi:hypothetical protein
MFIKAISLSAGSSKPRFVAAELNRNINVGSFREVHFSSARGADGCVENLVTKIARDVHAARKLLSLRAANQTRAVLRFSDPYHPFL